MITYETYKHALIPTPQVTLLDPLSDGISSLELVRVSGTDTDVVNAARVSFGKFVTEMTDRDKKLVRYLIQHNHTSPLEHNQISFRVKCPIFVARQWMRHRMHSYNEISYRYVKAPLEFYIPQYWRYQDTQNRQGSVGKFDDEQLLNTYKATLEACTQAYEHLLATGVSREQARALLPTAVYTEFIFTSNLHALMHFMRLRLHEGAQWEIRQYAQSMLTLTLPHFPVSLGAWEEFHMPKATLSQK